MSSISLFKNVSKLHRALSIRCVTRSLTCCLSTNVDRDTYNRKYFNSNGVLTIKTPHVGLPSCHYKSFSSKTDNKEDRKVKPVYHELYLFDKITFIRVLGRFAKYACSSFILGAPLCVLLTVSNVIEQEMSQLIIGNLAFYSLLFTSQSFIFSSRILGKMMITEDDERMIKLSHLSLFGNRKDIFLKPSDIVPLQDVSTALSKKLVMIRLKNSNSLIFLPDMGTPNTKYEIIELVLSGGLKGEDKD